MVGAHGPDGHVADDGARGRFPGQQVAGQMGGDQLERRIGEQLAERDAADQLDPVLGQALAQHLRQVRVGLDVHLVDHRSQHPHAVPLEQGVVEHDLVDRPAHAPLADDHHRRVQHLRHPRVGEADDRAHPRMARPLDQHHVLVLRHLRGGPGHGGGQVVGDAAHHVVGGEVARQGHRAHVVQGVGQVEDLLHQDGVLVGARAVDHHVALPDRLEEAEPMTVGRDQRRQPQRDGGLSPVLAGGGQEDAARPAHSRAFDRRSIRSRPSRSRCTSSASSCSGSRCSPSRSIMSAAMASRISASAMKNCGSLL